MNNQDFFNQLLDLQDQCDNLRSNLRSMSRFNQFGQDWTDKHLQLNHLDALLGRLCKSGGFTLNRHGRLTKHNQTN